MLFVSFEFVVFFAAVLLVLRTTPWALRGPVLLGASLLFYTLWLPSYVLLLLATLLANYALLRGIARGAASGKRSRAYLIASITLTLALLGLFKYAALLLETAVPLLRLFGLHGSHALRPPALLLPLGISFYSFEVISVAVDVYRGRLPCPPLSRYLLFVTFFPHLIAGPIMRGPDLLPQLERGGVRSPELTRRGLWLLTSGLAKKTVLADFALAPFVNEVFTTPGVASAPVHLLALYSFAFQIYFDFSGYTDLARGLGCLLGFTLPENFAEPYLSRTPSELWRRWHISLSSWLRDYLYLPLGGSRGGAMATARNLLLTMLLGGLWHGAAYTFVVWGGLHGLLLCIERALGRSAHVDEHAPLRLRDAPRVLLVFHLTCLLWVPFRAPTLEVAWTLWRATFGGSCFVPWPVLQSAIVLGCCGLHLAERWVRPRLPALQAGVGRMALGPVLEGVVLGAVAAGAVLASGAGAEFIYFQF